MRRLIPWSLALFASTTPLPVQADPVGLYGGELRFDIQRNGTPVGDHRVWFAPDGADGVRVTAQSSIAVPFLGFVAYRFRYRSVSVWRDGMLERMEASTDDDGDRSQVMVRRTGSNYEIDGSGGRYPRGAPLYTTDHWNAAVLGQSVVLNTITGQLNSVAITAQGREDRPTGTGPRPATRYAYDGELQAEVWYDDARRWVGLRFAARDGSVIDYICRQCGPAAEPGS